MKNCFVKTNILSFLFLSFGTPAHALETYLLDPAHTTITWSIDAAAGSAVSGKFSSVNGSLNLDESNLPNSKIFAVAKLNDLDTGNDTFNKKLLNSDFFDASHYPSVAFVSTKVEPTGKNSARVYGMMTIRGISKPEMLNVQFVKRGETDKHIKTIDFKASCEIKRSDFGLNMMLPAISDNVKIEIQSQTNFLK